jgi:hypothetical protein
MVRLTWGTLGNFLLIILIIVGTHQARNVLDVTFWLVVAGLIVARHLDIRVFHGHTADGGPGSMKVVARYSMGLIAAAGLFWGLAHAIVARVQ